MALQVLREAPGARAQIDPGLIPSTGIFAWLERQGRILKDDTHSRVALVEIGGKWYFTKLYLGKSALQQVGFRLGRGRAIRAFDAAAALAATTFTTTAVYAGSHSVTVGVSWSNFQSLWQAQAAGAPRMVQAAGLALAHLHVAGYAHGDCKWSNLLCSDGRILFADLEAVTGARPGSRAAARDLARFTLNAEDLSLPAAIYESFLTAYCDATRQTREKLVTAILVPLTTLRRRHLSRYGARGHTLLGGGQESAGRG